MKQKVATSPLKKTDTKKKGQAKKNVNKHEKTNTKAYNRQGRG